MTLKRRGIRLRKTFGRSSLGGKINEKKDISSSLYRKIYLMEFLFVIFMRLFSFLLFNGES